MSLVTRNKASAIQIEVFHISAAKKQSFLNQYHRPHQRKHLLKGLQILLTEHGHKIAAKLKSVHDTVVQRTTEYNGTMAETDPFFTYETAANLAHTDGYTSIHTRLNEKILRLSALSENGIPTTKQMEDCCADIIGHTVLLWQFAENANGRDKGEPLPVVNEILAPGGPAVKESPLQGLRKFLTGRK